MARPPLVARSARPVAPAARARSPEELGAATDVRIGVSSCLLGQNVRYDGGHKQDGFLTGLLAQFVRFIPVCPEVELGLGTPREAIRLVRDGALVRLVGGVTGADHTEPMRRLAEKRVAELARLDLDGYVLKKDSPSCGMERVKVYRGAVATRDGRGAFAAVLLDRMPLLPVEEEGRLDDLPLRENFVERVFAHRRLRELFSGRRRAGGGGRSPARRGRWTVGDLVRFHAQEKLLLLAHQPEAYRELGRLVAAAKRGPREELARGYCELYMKALARPATRGRHVSVLQHMAGYFDDFSPDE